MQHAIRHQHLHLEFNGSEAEAVAMHGKLTNWQHNSLLPEIERVLNRYAPKDDSYWQIERLEIDAGSIDLDRLETELAKQIGQALEQSLRGKTPGSISAQSAVHAFDDQAKTTGNDKQQTTRQRATAALVDFLKTGTLPWHFKLEAGQTLEQTVLSAWHGHPSATDAKYLAAALNSDIARKRLTRQFSADFLSSLLPHIAPNLQQTLILLFESLKLEHPTAIADRRLMQVLWEAALAPDIRSAEQLAVKAWQILPPMSGKRRARLQASWERVWPGTSGVFGHSNSWPAAQASNQQSSDAKSKRHSSSIPPGKKPPVNEFTGFDLPTIHESTEQLAHHPEAATGIYIEQAGLVILHPFLPQFLRALLIADGDRLTQPERALCLLHFLTTGQTIAPEQALPLPKLLCNVSLNQPVESDVVLSEQECQEAEALLTAVIGHWDALKNTGIEALRGTFLLRAGKLTQRDDGDWLLQVERQGYDILLDQLPWGIGTVKLPWMPSILWVEWA